MKNSKKPTPEFVDKILDIICLEKGLSKNTKIAYKKDIILVFEWFDGIPCIYMRLQI